MIFRDIAFHEWMNMILSHAIETSLLYIQPVDFQPSNYTWSHIILTQYGNIMWRILYIAASNVESTAHSSWIRHWHIQRYSMSLSQLIPYCLWMAFQLYTNIPLYASLLSLFCTEPLVQNTSAYDVDLFELQWFTMVHSFPRIGTFAWDCFLWDWFRIKSTLFLQSLY